MNYPQEQTLGLTASSSFMAQVFFYFGLAILISAAGAFIGLNYLATFFLTNPILMYVFFALELILIFTSRMWSAKRPINYIFFGAFAFITGITIVPILALFIVEFQGIDLIVKALLATTLMFSATALVGWTTSWNLSGLRGFLIASLIGMIIVSIIGIFIPWGNNFEMFISGFGVILFAGYTMYDIQQIKNQPIGNPMDAALRLYLDIFNLFIFILRLMGAFSRD